MFSKREDQKMEQMTFICKNCKTIKFAIQGDSIRCDKCNSLMSQMDVNKFTWENVLQEDNRREYINRFLGENNDYSNDTQLFKILEQLNKNVKDLTGYVHFFYVIGVISVGLSIIGFLFFFLSHVRY